MTSPETDRTAALRLRPPTTRTTSLADHVVLITGGASGLGRSVADQVDAAGGYPFIIDRNIGEPAWPFRQVDLSDTDATQRAVDTLLETAAPLAAVVTCAGTDTPAPFDTLPASEWEKVVRVNLFGTAAVIRAALPRLLDDRGRIVTVCSTLGHGVASDASAYCASKWGVVGLSRALCAEFKGRLPVTMVTPGGMATAFFDERDEQYRPDPDAPLCDPDDVAAVVRFVLEQPPECEIKEVVVAGPTEVSWP